jgi:cytochrome c2
VNRNVLRWFVLVPVTAGLFFLAGLQLFSVLQPERQSAAPAPAPLDGLESIFVALDVETVAVPVERAGNGGALVSIGNDLVVTTHEGRFFEVGGTEAMSLDIAPPPNGYDAMLAFAEANPEYQFENWYFRYNDVDLLGDLLIVSFTEWVAEDDCYRTTLASAPTGGASATDISVAGSDWTPFFSTVPCLQPNTVGRAIQGHMAGGRFRLTEDGTVILASGDYAMDGTYNPVALPQDPEALYGKVMEIDPEDGAIRIISQGHSNMQGIARDRDGEIWTVEHGRRGGDELNLIREGVDYGWPSVSLGTRYNRLPLPNTLEYGRHPEFQRPVHAWLPSVAISSLTRIEEFHPAWDGDFLAGSLAAQTLFRIRVVGDDMVFAERIPVGHRIRYVHQHGDEIVLWTDQKRVLRLRVGEFDASYQFAVAKIADLDLGERQAAAVESALESCSQCHGFGVTSGIAAPPLGEVFGRDIAGLADFPYSAALSQVGGSWDRERLIAYLDDTEGFAPGGSMPDPGLDDPEVIAAIVDILIALREQAE